MSAPLPPSLWAAVTPAGPSLHPLDQSRRTDAVIIGAGFTGLSAAIRLAELGIDVVVLEAAEPGWGASGRNNGQVIPTLTRPDPDDIEARHGDVGARFVALLRDSAATTFDLVRAHGLEAEAEQSGWIQPVHSPGRMAIAERRTAQWSKRGASVALLSRDEVEQLTGSRMWHGGWTNPTGGHINPLALARSMARRAVELGARVFIDTSALSYGHDGTRWHVETPRGTVTADTMLLATNAYTDVPSPRLAPSIAREIVPVLSWQMATTPLSDNVRSHVLPGRHAMSDTHGDLHFARYDARNRLVTGGALVVEHNGTERLKPLIAARLKRMFEVIGDVRVDYVWNGRIAMTTDFMPRLHRLGPNGYAWAGCNGRAVALGLALGREFARAMTGAPEHELALPFTDPKPLPLHGALVRLAPLRLIEFRWRDAREI